jgi:hypothetical protein
MKRTLHFLLALCLISTAPLTARAQGTAFTYQGSLQNNGSPVNGIYDVTFTLFGSSGGGAAIAGPVTNTPTTVSNGLFTVTLDFGSVPFGGNLRWLEIAVRTNGSGGFSTLAPRQQLTPTPYAIFASSASNLTGTVTSSQVAGTYGNPVNFNNGANNFDGTFSGQFFGSTFIGGSFVGNFIGSGSGLGDVWHTGGNIGTTPANFLGTIDNQSLILKVNGQRATQIDPTPSDSANINAGAPVNIIDNGVSGAVIAGGGTTNFLGSYSANQVSASFSSIGGGSGNLIQAGADHSMIGNGWGNWLQLNTWQSFLGGGEFNTMGGQWSVLGGGENNTIQASANYSMIGGGLQNLIEANAGLSVIAGGWANNVLSNADQSVIAGGNGNKIMPGARESFIGGGFANTIQTNAYTATIGGGHNNSNASDRAVIAGGYFNVIGSNSVGSSVLGGWDNIIQTNSGWSSIGAGYQNRVDPYSLVSSIAGGFQNVIQGDAAYWSNNNVFGSAIAGGAVNTILTNAAYATIGGGLQNTIQTNAFISTISGGYNNLAGYGAMVPGGRDNVASGNYSLAAGRSAHATNDGSFVLTDDQGVNFYSTSNNQLSARFGGGIVFQTAGAGMTLDGQPILAGIVPSGDLSGPYPNAVTFSNPGNSFSGNGSGLGGVNASTLNGVPSTGFWSTTGNAGTTPGANFIGTSDGQNLLIKGSFVGIGRSNPIGAEFFGVQAAVSGANYGGMFINTTTATGKPFYGYSLNNGQIAWSYVDGSDANKWKLNLGGDRLTVTTAGFVGIGTTAPDATLSVNGTADKPGGGSWTVFSDARLKKNVQPLEGALDRLMRLQGVTFEYKDPGAIHELPGAQIGMIAQEVEKVFPDWVDTAPTGMKRLSIHGFEALTVEALRDLRKEKDDRIAALEAENARRQSELAKQKANTARLEARLSALEKILLKFAGTEQPRATGPLFSSDAQ